MREPTKQGRYAKAWLLAKSTQPRHAACLGTWLVHAPHSHPIWPWKLISVVHLRDVPGVAPAQKRYPEAAYELIVVSIDPEKCPSPNPEEPDSNYPLLQPLDICEQFHGLIDLDAAQLLELAIKAVCDGLLVPDQDFRSVWSASIQGTAQHMREGAHIRS